MKNDLFKITKDIFSYNFFVQSMEDNYGNLDVWLSMEILNSLALEAWENDEKPIIWLKWNEEYHEKAIELVNTFINTVEKSN